jgi:myo-inositol 2-dehydrogenase/D-chiro-inositol 1-dehydrogenase
MKKKVRIGLIGAGRIGRLHGENLAQAIPDADLCAIADPCLNDEMKSWASSLNITECYKETKKIMADSTIKAVYICSSTGTHVI